MMKLISATVLLFILISGNAQEALIPGKHSFEKQWLKNRSYEMSWYLLNDTTKIEIGTITTYISITKKVLVMITKVSMNNGNSSWIDSTHASIKTLKPIRHSSYNKQRDIILNFGDVVTGSYHDKLKSQSTIIRDTVIGDYFDSNLYPLLITCLPLKEDYRKDIFIYDYNPNTKIGIMKVSIVGIKGGVYHSRKDGRKDVWIVSITDEISNAASKYYIDKRDRTLWKQEITAGGNRNMLFERN
jgi:hypothetical protein